MLMPFAAWLDYSVTPWIFSSACRSMRTIDKGPRCREAAEPRIHEAGVPSLRQNGLSLRCACDTLVAVL